MKYSIDVINKEVRYIINIKEPELGYNNGKVNSIYDCGNGFVAISLDINDKIKANIENFSLCFGKDYSVQKGFKLTLLDSDEPFPEKYYYAKLNYLK
jgi:hypothetical protein